MKTGMKAVIITATVVVLFAVYKYWIIEPLISKFPMDNTTVLLNNKEYQIIYSTKGE